MTLKKPKILVLGAGYAGMMTTKRLTQKLTAEEAEITLVNKYNYHYQSTWLHEVAAGTMHPNQARIMISDIIKPSRVNLVYDEVVEIKKAEKTVVLNNSELTYDYLVIALGFVSNTFGIKGMDEHAFAIEDIDSSREISDHIEYQFSKYNNSEDKDAHALTVLVGGGGFTGIELVGELAERIPKLCKKYDIDRSLAKIINIEASPSILPMFDKDLVAYAKKSLEDRGVEFKLGAKISECTKDGFIINEGEPVLAGTIVWTGGVTGNPILGKSGFELNRGKVTVNDDLRLPEEDDIFVLGDCSWVMDKATDRPYPPTAQLAIQESDVAADNLCALIRNQPEAIRSFVFDSKGTVASLGVTDAIGNILNDRKLKGKSAATIKKVVDNRYLFLLGGPKLFLKKGKFRPF